MRYREIRFYYGLADVPNTEGYRFRGWLYNGDLIPCVVMKSDSGMHYVAEEDTKRSCYHDLKGWTPYMD